MMKSMTAFGRAKREGEHRDITVELRSVNSRFFDCSVKIPHAYLFLEEKIKTHIRQNAVSRAKIDVYFTIEEHASGAGEVLLDEAYLEGYLAALRKLRDDYHLTDDITVMSVAKNPAVFRTKREEADLTEAWEEIRPVLDEAIAGYVAMRTAEGERAAEDMKKKIDLVRTYVDRIEAISACDTVGYRDKLEARLRTLLGENGVPVDENRLLTECAVFADKIAVDEEIVRLRSHFDAFSDIVALPEPSGRKLDFLMQEMNRETNTIGSKANNADIAKIVVSIKGELEKIREQVQNIE
ncbi:MAG TPA: YicC family protein [Clostridiales bacterium]|nr:YicC family protein [Clostridiales bacterium]